MCLFCFIKDVCLWNISLHILCWFYTSLRHLYLVPTTPLKSLKSSVLNTHVYIVPCRLSFDVWGFAFFGGQKQIATMAIASLLVAAATFTTRPTAICSMLQPDRRSGKLWLVNAGHNLKNGVNFWGADLPPLRATSAEHIAVVPWQVSNTSGFKWHILCIHHHQFWQNQLSKFWKQYQQQHMYI